MPTIRWLPERTRPLAVSRKGPPEDDALTKLQQKKMLWVGEPGGSPEAEWSDGQPELEKIKAVLTPCLYQLGAGCVENLEVAFLARGTWNQVFLVVDKDHGHEFIFRVSLPVYPWYKTEAEVATIQFIHDCTVIPAPRVYAFDSSADNELGYEWMLMEKLPGVPYRSVADHLSLDARLAVARTVAEWVDQLSRRQFGSIGSFYFDSDSEKLRLGRPVIQQFMGDWRHDYHHRRGPFDNLHSYIRSFVDCIGTEMFDPRQRLRAIIDVVDDEIRSLEGNSGLDGDVKAARLKRLEANYSALLASTDVTENAAVDFETFRYRLALPGGGARNELSARSMRLVRLTDLVDTIYAKPLGPEDTILYHWDISENNVLVDPSSHHVTGLIDWEQLYTVPLILLRTRYPPIMAREGDFPDFAGPPTPPSEDEFNGGNASAKSNSVEFWERQQMREEFDRQLRNLQSPWLAVGKDSKDEAGGPPSDADFCRKCYRLHRVTAESRLMDISELAQADVYCEGILDGLEQLEKARNRPHHFVWLE